eukprot:TRINITY_DN25341_c0_g1_i2.p2 TRINITY_DN25341_c0_g1~~TRINITY_DN25341_c0_g1_i2.p2  ORF type:complete len:123 (+),score=14.60 TRINITY_DN25341_c0_g1_i2:272-640(+)
MMQQPIHLTTPELGRLLVELSMLQSRQTGSQGGSPPGLPPTAVGDIVHMASRPLATGASAGFAPPMKVEMTSLASLRPLCAHALSLGGGDFAFVDTGRELWSPTCPPRRSIWMEGMLLCPHL